jgi:Tfp pilus assembly protein PilO
MGARNSGRLWVIAGAAVVVLLALVSWFFLISPKYAEASDVRGQVEDTQTQLITLRKKISELQRQAAQLPTFKAELQANQRALPSNAGIPAFLNQLQAAGDNVGVSVTGISVSAPLKSTAATDVWELPMTLTVEGDADRLSLFLTQMQSVQPRAVLVKSANFTANESAAAGGNAKPTISVGLTTFVSPPAGSGAPIVTTK